MSPATRREIAAWGRSVALLAVLGATVVALVALGLHTI